MNKTVVYEKIKELLISNFELKADSISPEKDLSEDLDLDSLDIVELILGLSDYLGKKIDPTLFNDACKVQDLVDSVAPLWKSE